jgi:chromosome partitioning protein
LSTQRAQAEPQRLPPAEAGAVSRETTLAAASEPVEPVGTATPDSTTTAERLAEDEPLHDDAADPGGIAGGGAGDGIGAVVVPHGGGTAPQAYIDRDDPETLVAGEAAGEPPRPAAGSAPTPPETGSGPQAGMGQSEAVSRETAPGESKGLPDTATQDVEQARFGPTLAPAPMTSAPVAPAPTSSAPMTAAQIADAEPAASDDLSTPLAAATQQHVRAAAGLRGLPRPAQTRVLVIANQKGGVGKTTTTVNMAAGLAQHGQRVLIIDLDPQGNASTALGIDHSAGTPGIYEVLTDGKPLGDVVRGCPDLPNLYGVPATIDLAGAEIELVSLVARESRLRKALDAYLAELKGADRFDYVFIDCPPSLGLLTINALVAGREMLIPIQCEYYALEGVTQLLRNVEMVRAHLNPDLRVSTIVLTMYDARTRLAAGVADEVRQHFGDLVLRTAIPRSVRISEAPSYGQTVMTYDPTSSGALSYLEASRELAVHQPNQQPDHEEVP